MQNLPQNGRREVVYVGTREQAANFAATRGYSPNRIIATKGFGAKSAKRLTGKIEGVMVVYPRNARQDTGYDEAMIAVRHAWRHGALIQEYTPHLNHRVQIWSDHGATLARAAAAPTEAEAAELSSTLDEHSALRPKANR